MSDDANSGLVVLDRDGVVVVEVDGWIDEPSRLCLESGALEGMTRLTRAGYRLAIATNQSGIGRGEVSAEAVDSVHRALVDRLAQRGIELVGVFVCPHVDDDRCTCRKPSPELIRRAMAAAGVPPERTWVVGDMARDLEAGRAAGAHTALVRTGKGRTTERSYGDAGSVFDDLVAFADRVVDDGP